MMEDGVATIDLGDSADQYRIDSLPEHGTLTLNGAEVAEGDVITQAQIDAGDLTFTPDADWNGSTAFEFSAHDGQGWSDQPANFDILVNPVDDAPLAEAGADQTVDEGDLVQLSATASDVEGQPLSFEWVQVSGPAVTLSDPTSASPTFVAPEDVTNTEVVFELHVSDGTNASIDSVTVTINADDDAPSADAGEDFAAEEGDTVTLSGSGSDAEDQELTYEWVQVSGPQVTLDDPASDSPTFTAPEGVANTDVAFELRVSDGTNTSIDTVNVTINANDDAPSANAGPDFSVDEGDAVTLTGAGADVENADVTYEWVQVAGPKVILSDPHAATPTFTAPDVNADEEVRFELRVSDGTITSVDTVAVTIIAAPQAPTEPEAPPVDVPADEPNDPVDSTPGDTPGNEEPVGPTPQPDDAEDDEPAFELPVDLGPVVVGPGDMTPGGTITDGSAPSGDPTELPDSAFGPGEAADDDPLAGVTPDETATDDGGTDDPVATANDPTGASGASDGIDWNQLDGEQLRAQLRILESQVDDVTFADRDADMAALLREFAPAGELRVDPVVADADPARWAFGGDEPGKTAAEVFDVVGLIAVGDVDDMGYAMNRRLEESPVRVGGGVEETGAELSESTVALAESESHALPAATAVAGTTSVDGFLGKLWSALRGTAGAIGPRDRKEE
jgi:hypothetical protein